jgi:predicted acylesterase/phospholipase RssA
MEEDPDKRGGIHLVILGHDGRDTHLAWLAREGDRAFRPPQDAPHHLSADALRALCEEDDPPKRLHTRIIVVAPHAWRPAHDLGKLEGLRRAFDRIIYVTARMPLEHPPRMLDLLADCYREGNEAFYTSFVATVIGAPKGTPTASGSFRARILPDPAIDREPVVGARLFRDAVRLPVAPDYIRRLWSRGPPPTRAFIDQVPPIVRARARRWARAVTNRRVGVALSGGGASAFRAAGLLEVFDEQDIPVDVLVGLSGGALVGAYYCANTIGRVRDAASAKKFAKIEARGPMLQRALPLGVLSTYLLERWVDEDLGGIRVEDQDVRFVAVATELAVGDEPRSVVIESGTMGEAVRASGSLPPTLAPMWKEGARYTDGGAASIVPAQVARDCGADIVFACNVIPRAALSNPLERYGLGQFVQEFTPLGRILDAWTWYAHLWSGASRRYGRLADVFLEFEPQDLPFVEGARDFSAGARIRGDAQRGKELREKVGAFNRHFLTLSR